MDTQSKSWGWGFVGLWTVTGTLGVVVLGFAAFASVWSLGDMVMTSVGEVAGAAVAGAAFGALFAIGLNLGPSQLLQKRGIPARRWIGWSALAGALGMALVFALLFTFFDPENMPETIAGPVVGISFGLSLGLGQWRALGARPGAALWPAIVVAALIAAFTVGLPLGGEDSEWLSLGAIGLLASGITGLAMGWLLSTRRGVAMAS